MLFHQRSLDRGLSGPSPTFINEDGLDMVSLFCFPHLAHSVHLVCNVSSNFPEVHLDWIFEKNHDMQYIMDAKNPKCAISLQMQLVTVKWLSTSHPAFSSKYISQSVLEKLVRQHCKKVEITMFNEMNEAGAVVPRAAKLYTKNEFSDKFILILEGRALCTIGQDCMVFDAGPWQVFGVEILEKLEQHCKQTEDIYRSHSSISTIEKYKDFGFYPDFTMVVKQECTFIEISASDWLLAYKSTMLKKNKSDKSPKELLRTTSRSSLADLQPKTVKNNHLVVNNKKKRSRSESEHSHLHSERVPLCEPGPSDIHMV